MRWQVLHSLVIVLALAVLRLHPCFAVDAVTVLTGKDAKTRAHRTGEIIELTGESLQLKTSSGRVETIPAARVLEIRSPWTPAYDRGEALYAQGKSKEAIHAYKQALRDEPRTWARRKIMAELVVCYAETGQMDFAGNEWLAIVSSDPRTLFYDVIPVAWSPLPPNAELQTRAASWLHGKAPPAQVLGASWLLGGAQRGEALAVLEDLVSSKTVDSRIRSLAQIQLWRTKLVSVKLEELRHWQSTIEEMPAEVRATGYFVAGEALARLGEPEAAALAYLHVPLMHGRQRVMAADALVAAAMQHEKLGRTEQAAALYREVLSGYSRTAAAEEAKAWLDKR
jgi:tetratricopeptide (TPR) repeat protein